MTYFAVVAGSKPLVKDLPVVNKSVFKDLSGSSSKARSLEKNSEKKKKSALEEIMEEEEARKKRKLDSESSKRKEKSEVKDYWLKENIVVKIVTKSLGDKYYKQKGYVKQVLDKFVAVVVPLSDTGSKIKLDQDHLETVVPAVGKKVLVVNGLYRREVGELVKVDFGRFCATIRLEEDQKEVELPYEHFSKLYK